MDVLWRDVLLAVRMLRKNLRFSLMVIAIIAVGIGAGATILSVVEAALMRGWPNAERIFVIRSFFPSKNVRGFRFSAPELAEARQIGVFEAVGGISGGRCTVIVDNVPEARECTQVTHEVMPMRLTAPILGRGFGAQDDRPGAPRTVILGYNVWQQRFHGRKDVLGQSLRIGDLSYTVIGVMPAHYDLWGGELWTALQLDPADDDRGNRWFWILTLVNKGVSAEQANAAVGQFARQLEQQYGGSRPEYAGMQMDLWNVKQAVVAAVRPSLLILLGAVGLLLVIACGNVGSLLLVRAAGRQREMAIRAALGATRGRIVRQLLTESVVLAGAGGVLGMLLASWGIPSVVAMVPWDLLPNNPVRLDAMPMLVSVGVSVMVGVLIGLAPSLFAGRRDLAQAVKESGAQAGRGRQARLTHAGFVVAEIAVAVVVLVGAGLMVRTYRELLRLDVGFRTENVISMDMPLPPQRYPDAAHIKAFYQQLLPRLEAQPGIEGVAGVTGRPLVDRTVDLLTEDFELEGRRGEKNVANANYRVITPRYFDVAGVRLLSGRRFNEADDTDHAPVVIINRTMAKMFWGKSDPVGQRIHLANAWQGSRAEGRWATVVGVVADAKQIRVLEAPVRQEMYFPLWQRPERGISLALMLRSRLPKAAVADAVRRTVQSVDPQQPIAGVYTMEQIVSDAFGPKRLTTALLGFFAFLAVTLASVGLYALIAYSVAQRTREFGLRMALGAGRKHILHLVLRESSRLVAIGVAAGVIAALAATRVMTAMLYGVSATDPATFVGVAALLAIVAAVASFVPARRATQVDPMCALRTE